ncbi:penicillin-binding protein 1C [Inquilinus ginsengisoli]|uniref:peptidoglycan glycosyltransferase n=1 Tax=Inquilinus ginsengisoli TaxID=363840 RepID=A0ABU1JVM5_9PROT|nr:penicillin-binding protein 1C [Inquilinus ginsengisoli]MDR6292064.1 penicillin-binding protein 1C [Inquilinus ginsengisoli]
MGAVRTLWRRIAIGAAAGMVLAALVVGAAFWLDARYPPVLDRYLDRSAIVLDKDGQLLRAFTAHDGTWRLKATVADVSPLYLAMLQAYEDRRFRRHLGVDPLATARAFGQMVRHGGVVSGASTLTMQTVRLLEPRPRTLGSKLIEMARALQLEAHYSKDEILGIYLTLAPFGGNLEGVRAASLAYFGKEPTLLTPGEAALMVALPQSPTKLRPDRFPKAARAARDRVLLRVAGAGALDPQAAQEATEQPTPTVRRLLPFRAPHLAERLVAEDRGREVHRSTIDGRLQGGLEELADRSLRGLDATSNLAAVVIENATGRVVGYLGSGTFFEERRDGQIDLARAVRSPGSALKPFIYGMGFEDRIILPETVVLDLPMRFGDYAPNNFDPGFSGEVSVREALQRSLNIPAVQMLDHVGPARFAARLRNVGAPLRFDDPTVLPSLPIALGGGGTTLLDLVRLYAGIARGGILPDLVWRADAPPSGTDGPRILDASAAWYVTDILASAPPPVAMADPGLMRDGRRIAFKTGTSYGFRDAWAIGFDAEHTIGVWVGRPDGSPSPDRFGRNTAAPLLFRAFALLPPPAHDVVGPAPSGTPVLRAEDLPPRLQRLSPDAAVVAPLPSLAGVEPLAIAFPVDGVTVERPRDGDRFGSLSLVAAGGRRPFLWMVDGRPIPSSPMKRDADWTPPGPGAAQITVIDATGATATARVWLR